MSPATSPEDAIRRIEAAQRPVELFYARPAAVIYKELLTMVHPDRFPAGAQRNRASEAARKLAQLYSQVNGKTASPAVIGPWVVEAPLVKGDLADLYLVTSEKQGDGVLKIARSAADNDLMDAESRALKTLWKVELSSFHKYLPQILDAFQASGRRVNVLDRHPGYYTLRQIRGLLPGVIDFRHIVWMMNRLLSLIVFTQSAGYVHGGITPGHLLYHPETHGLILAGWCSAVPAGQAVPIAAKEWLHLYAPEVRAKRPATVAADIFMAAQSMLWTPVAIPRRFRGLLEWCTAASPGARPKDAVELQDMWIRLAEQEYGKPKYLKLDLPVQ